MIYFILFIIYLKFLKAYLVRLLFTFIEVGTYSDMNSRIPIPNFHFLLIC
jgi:hypothetical protein